MRTAAALGAILLVGCSQASTSSPSAASSRSPVASPSAAMNLACRLPIGTPDGRGAFISFPSATVSFDPKGKGLHDYGGAYYDRAFSRWLPVNRNSVSSNGARYVYLEPKVPGTPGRARLHVVDVSSGKDRLYELGPRGDVSAYVVVDFAPEGIWLSYSGYEAPGGGLFVLNLATGVLKEIGGRGILEPVAGGRGVFWFTDGGPSPQVAAIGFTIPARVNRLTISNGKTEAWFSKPGSYLRVLGTDVAGQPIILNQDNRTDVWRAVSPSEAKVIGLPQGDYQLIADIHGVWFGSHQGVYLYTDAGRLTKVSNQPGYPANGCF